MEISMKQEVKIWIKNNKIQEVKGYDFMWGNYQCIINVGIIGS